MKKQILRTSNSRQVAIQAAIGSVRCEGLNPSLMTQKHLQDYSSGKINSAQLHRNVIGEVNSILARNSN